MSQAQPLTILLCSSLVESNPLVTAFLKVSMKPECLAMSVARMSSITPCKARVLVRGLGRRGIAYRSELLVLFSTQVYIYVVLRLCRGGEGGEGREVTQGCVGEEGHVSPCPVSGRPWRNGDSPGVRYHCIVWQALSWH